MTAGPAAGALAALIVGAAVAGCSDATDTAPSPQASAVASASTGAVPPTSTAPPEATDGPASSPPSLAPSPPGPDAAADPPARLEEELDAAGFATRLSAAHDAMTDTEAPVDQRARAGADYQLILRSLAVRPDLDETVIDTVDPAARPAVERIIRARRFLQARAASRPQPPAPDDLPAWTVVEPEPVDTLQAHYAEAEAATGIPWYWLAAIHLQETRMGRIRGVSSAGAVGPMQFLPTTWEVCCTGDPTNTRDAIIGAATYLAQSGGPGDMAAALYEYNPNDGYVAVVTAYAESLRDEPELYPGYHGFQVFFGASAGTVRLPIGYAEPAPVDADEYLAAHPEDAG